MKNAEQRDVVSVQEFEGEFVANLPYGTSRLSGEHLSRWAFLRAAGIEPDPPLRTLGVKYVLEESFFDNRPQAIGVKPVDRGFIKRCMTIAEEVTKKKPRNFWEARGIVLKLSRFVLDLQSTVSGTEDLTLEAIIPAPEPEYEGPDEDASEQLEAFLACLTEKEREVLGLRWGTLDGKERTLEETARELPRPVTRERVRQIEKKALGKIRKENGIPEPENLDGRRRLKPTAKRQ